MVGLRTVGGAVGPGSAVDLVVLVRAVVAGPLSGVSVSISPQDRAEVLRLFFNFPQFPL